MIMCHRKQCGIMVGYGTEQQIQDKGFVVRIQIAGRFVG